ncbi:MAG: hypothetical protein KDE27_31960, partial [Planctomycetes bacterium]|nr:hypothetical protein [Planctomycetota bacterium]
MDPRLALAAGSVLLASSLAAQTLAEFDFDSFTLSSPQPSFATVSDLQISNTWMYGGPSGDVWLCLTTDWNAVGGTVSFTVTPTGGVAIDYGTLAWDAVTGNSS